MVENLMKERVALYGGSFFPIHFGHLIAARAAAEQLDLDRVVFLPSAWPPHKACVSIDEANHRSQMVQLAIEGEPRFEFSDYDLTRSGPTYTFDTVSHFAESLGAHAELHWLIGADSLQELGSWYRIHDLLIACRIITMARPGIEEPLDHLVAHLGVEQVARLRSGILSTPVIEISSTEIRRRVAKGRSIRYLVPESVRAYIQENGLFIELTIP